MSWKRSLFSYSPLIHRNFRMGAYDQFAENQSKFGVKSDFDMTVYTTYVNSAEVPEYGLLYCYIIIMLYSLISFSQSSIEIFVLLLNAWRESFILLVIPPTSTFWKNVVLLRMLMRKNDIAEFIREMTMEMVLVLDVVDVQLLPLPLDRVNVSLPEIL